MNRGISQRVASAEHRLGLRGPCPLCGGEGMDSVRLEDCRGRPFRCASHPLGVARPGQREGCPGCGKISEEVVLVLADDGSPAGGDAQ